VVTGRDSTGLFGRKPEKRVAVAGNTLFHLQSGRIDEMWVAFDPTRLA
jgi:hypothetical protein